MGIQIVDVGVAADLHIKCRIHLTAPYSFRANGNKMVGIKLADECRRFSQPTCKGLLFLVAKGTRLITYLPRHDSRVVLI